MKWMYFLSLVLGLRVVAAREPKSSGDLQTKLPTKVAKSSSAGASVVDGRVIRFTKNSLVFSAPSPKSQTLADVEADTVVIVRKLSPKKTWILVEDEDRNQGWVPRDRTDFVELPNFEEPRNGKKAERGIFDQMDAAESSESSVEKPMAKSKSAEAPPSATPSSGYSHYAALLGRKSFSDPNGSASWGLVYALSLPRVFVMSGADSRELRMSLGLGYLRASKKNYAGNFSLPLRLKMTGRELNSVWTSGPDLSIFYMREPRGTDKNMYSLGLGYSVGYLPRKGAGIHPSLRLGFEVFHKTRLSLEAALGYLL